MRTVTINAVLNGWTVQVGCQTLVYTDANKLVGDLRQYMRNPDAKEKDMCKTAINRRLLDRSADLPRVPTPSIPDLRGLTANQIQNNIGATERLR